MFEKDLRMTELLDRYGAVLGDRPRVLLEEYYNEDLSLGEIAAEVGITRQGVRESIKKAEEELLFLEARLQLAARGARVRAAGEKALSLAGNDAALTAAVRELLRAAGEEPE